MGVKRRAYGRVVAGAGLGAGAVLGMPAGAQAAVNSFTVDNLTDDSTKSQCTAAVDDCSLRGAIAAADEGDLSTDVDQITFQAGLSGTITLATTQLTIDEPLSIEGPGAATVDITGSDARRVFYVTTLGGATVTISDLTIRDGAVTAAAPAAATGGAILVNNAAFTLEDAVITGSTATATGIAYAAGAGISVNSGSLAMRRSTVSGNVATANNSHGGGVHANWGSSLTVENSTISANSALATYITDYGGTAYGGGIDSNYMVATTIRRSTVSGNSAGQTASTAGWGGGVHSRNGPFTIEDSTVSDNSAGPFGQGGGIATYTPSNPDPVATNAMVANNSGTNVPDLSVRDGNPDPPNPALQASFTLVENTAGGPINATVAGSNITGVDPQLGPLAANGGPTRTHRPAATSPAIDKGKSLGPTDQRGLTRPVDHSSIANSAATGANGADIGAVELQAAEIAGQIEIEKQTAPNGDPTLFSFTATALPGTADDAFSLADEGVKTVPGVAPGQYGVSEDAAAGFDLTGLGCNDGTSPTPSTTSGRTATLNLDPGETVRCVFTNTKQSPVSPPPILPTATPPPAVFNLKAAIRKCKKKFPPGPKRTKCIKRAKARA